MSQKTTLIVQTGPERIEDGRPTYDVRLLPNDESIAQLNGRHMPEVRMQLFRENPNQYTDRYVLEGLVIANIDKSVTARLIAVATCMAASKLHAGRESFLEQGATAEVLSGVDGLINFTYEAAGDVHKRLISTTMLSALSEELAEAGFEFPIAKEAKISEVPGASSVKPTHNANMLLSRDEGEDGKVYDLVVLKVVPEGEEEQPFVLAQIRVRPVTLAEQKVYDLATIDVMTLGYDLAPWSKYDATMVVGQACMGLLPMGNPLLVGFSRSVEEEYDIGQVLMPPMEGGPELLKDVYLLAATKLDQETTALAMAGMQVGFTKPEWVH